MAVSLETPTDLLLGAHLEVIPERPGAQHLEEGVMIDILAHVVQVVVLPPSPDAFLGIGSSPQLCHRVRRVNSVQEDGFELKKGRARFVSYRAVDMSGGHTLAGRDQHKLFGSWFN